VREVTFDLPMPPSVNAMFANGGGKYGRSKTKLYKDWIRNAGWMLVTQRNVAGPHKRFDCDVEVVVRAYRVNKNRDLDNILKAIMDLLTGTQTIVDDSKVVSIDAKWVDAGVPCAVTVREAS
jgi:crossover junction endodeoxyribonuclease RusA